MTQFPTFADRQVAIFPTEFDNEFVNQLWEMYHDHWQTGYISNQYINLPTMFEQWSGVLNPDGLRKALIPLSKMLLWMGEKAFDQFIHTILHRGDEQQVIHKILTITPFTEEEDEEEEEVEEEEDQEEEEEEDHTIETVSAMANAALESVNNLKRRLENDNDNGESKRQHTD